VQKYIGSFCEEKNAYVVSINGLYSSNPRLLKHSILESGL